MEKNENLGEIPDESEEHHFLFQNSEILIFWTFSGGHKLWNYKFSDNLGH